MTEPRFPKATVEIDRRGPDGNAYVIMARAALAMKKAGATPAEIDGYYAAATSGNHEKLLEVTRSYVNFVEIESDANDDYDEEFEDYD